MDLSIVIPLFNEEESLPELIEWINKVVKENNIETEVILVDDGSKDSSWRVIKDLKSHYPMVKGIRFRRNYGKSAALQSGFSIVKGKVVITMDADLQDSPDEIPELFNLITKDGFDLISGWKKKRHDPISKTLPTKLFNWATRKMSGIYLHDFNCGLKAYSADVIKSIEVYGEMHRYIPVIAKSAGFTKIGEKVVQHRPRKYGQSKFGMSRFVNGLLDLLSISFMSRFSRRPMHFFGFVGILMAFVGFLIEAYLTYDKYFNHGYNMPERPLFHLGLLLIIVGSFFFLAGFLGELIARNSSTRNDYIIKETINTDGH